MTTVVDSNILVALWDRSETVSSAARQALDQALNETSLVVPAPVYAELMAGRGRTPAFLDAFFRDTAIRVDWSLEERVWRAAGLAFQQYAVRRQRRREPGPRRLLTDFVIGAYAAVNGFRLLTLDQGLYRAGFPELKILMA